jgi:hypothetical protein
MLLQGEFDGARIERRVGWAVVVGVDLDGEAVASRVIDGDQPVSIPEIPNGSCGSIPNNGQGITRSVRLVTLSNACFTLSGVR